MSKILYKYIREKIIQSKLFIPYYNKHEKIRNREQKNARIKRKKEKHFYGY